MTSQLPQSDKLQRLLVQMDDAIAKLASAPDFAKPGKVGRVFDTARRILLTEAGAAALESRAQTIEEAGSFAGSDWADPHTLVPSLTQQSLQSNNADVLAIEALSELRLLATAKGDYIHPSISAEQAHHYLTQVLAINLTLLFSSPGEAERETQGRLAELPRMLVRHLADRIGYEHVIDTLIDEIWRILRQRPIQIDPVKQMITQIAICRTRTDVDLGNSGVGAERLVSSLFGPTQACREDPGVEVYQQRIEYFDSAALQAEATGFARAMHDTGLVSPYHAMFLRYLNEQHDHLLVDALGLSGTGRDSLLCYRELVRALIAQAVHPATAQAAYGLAMMLERGILYRAAVAPSLWRQLHLVLSEWSHDRLQLVFGNQVPATTRLLEGVLCMLGLPLGVGQGNNPTCQSARALSIWAYNDPDYLLQIIASAVRDDEIVMNFEGQPISSRALLDDPTRLLPFDLDPVSLLLVPHLDYVYSQMGQLCIGREGDPHRWINPEFHGWWVGRGFSINVDVATGQLTALDDFLRHFYAYYHPYYNGNQPLIHPQPAGIAVTDSAARFIGWHAITIQRVALDPSGEMRVYFFNPNNDSGQDWGDGVKVDTADNGEVYGESSLPVALFASRLYIFHYDTLERGEPENVAIEELETIKGYIYRSWGSERRADPGMQASDGVV